MISNTISFICLPRQFCHWICTFKWAWSQIGAPPRHFRRVDGVEYQYLDQYHELEKVMVSNAHQIVGFDMMYWYRIFIFSLPWWTYELVWSRGILRVDTVVILAGSHKKHGHPFLTRSRSEEESNVYCICCQGDNGSIKTVGGIQRFVHPPKLLFEAR